MGDHREPLFFYSLQGSTLNLAAYVNLDPWNIQHPPVVSLQWFGFGWIGAVEISSLAFLACQYVMSLNHTT